MSLSKHTWTRYVGENENAGAHGERERVAYMLKESKYDTFLLATLFFLSCDLGKKGSLRDQVENKIGLAYRFHNIHVL